MALRGRRRNRTSPLLEGLENKRKRYTIWGLLVLGKFYIVDISVILKPRYIPKPLDSRKEARWVINTHLDGNTERFKVESAYVIAKYRIIPYRRYMANKVTKNQLSLKYDYPTHRTTHQQKKDFRTMARRRMREWMKKLELK